ncbi:MAG: putative Ig domain-containing protein, partial [Chloroflexota bacterium]|nr:putative Ig domain-containing protein [Chloroflexota bacterium]
ITPAADLYGASQITITITDDEGLSNSDVFTLTVNPVNDAPEFTSTPVENATVGQLYTYTVTAADVDMGDALTITAPTLPSWLTLVDYGGGVALLSETPAEADLGAHPVELLVHDSGGLTDTQIFSITVVRGTYYIYLPLVLKNYVIAPDLVVESVTATSNSIQIVISNQGPAPIENVFANEFWVDVYINPDHAPVTVNETWQQVGNRGAAWGITVDALPLNFGEVLTLTVTATGGDVYYHADMSNIVWPLASGTLIYAQVDSAHKDTPYGAIYENHEIINAPYENNILGPHSSTTVVSKLLPTNKQRGASIHLPPRP